MFLNELPEFNRDVLVVMRQPLENVQLATARAAVSLTHPARFILCGASPTRFVSRYEEAE